MLLDCRVKREVLAHLERLEQLASLDKQVLRVLRVLRDSLEALDLRVQVGLLDLRVLLDRQDPQDSLVRPARRDRKVQLVKLVHQARADNPVVPEQLGRLDSRVLQAYRVPAAAKVSLVILANLGLQGQLVQPVNLGLMETLASRDLRDNKANKELLASLVVPDLLERRDNWARRAAPVIQVSLGQLVLQDKLAFKEQLVLQVLLAAPVSQVSQVRQAIKVLREPPEARAPQDSLDSKERPDYQVTLVRLGSLDWQGPLVKLVLRDPLDLQALQDRRVPRAKVDCRVIPDRQDQ